MTAPGCGRVYFYSDLAHCYCCFLRRVGDEVREGGSCTGMLQAPGSYRVRAEGDVVAGNGSEVVGNLRGLRY